MRPVIAVLLSVFLFAGVYGYTEFARRVRKPPVDFSAKLSSNDYSLEISRTFDCIGDSGWEDVKSLVVKFRGEEIISEVGTVPATRRIYIERLEGVLQRGNNIFVFANLRNPDDFSTFGDDWGDDFAGGDFAGGADAAANGARDGDWEEGDNSELIEGEVPEGTAVGAMRILVRQGEKIVADETFWLEPDAMTIEESLTFEAPVEDGDQHDH